MEKNNSNRLEERLTRSQEVGYEGGIPGGDFVGGGSMGAGEVVTDGVVFQEEGFEMGQGVVVAEEADDVGFMGMDSIELAGLYGGELADELFVDGEILMAVFPW